MTELNEALTKLAETASICGHGHQRTLSSIKRVESLVASREKEALDVNGHMVAFQHTAVNKDMHMFIGDDSVASHDPDICPECIQPGIFKARGDTPE